MKKRTNPEGYMTTPKERQSYWNYFVGQNAYYYLTATFLSTYLAMQGVSLAKVAVVLLIVKIWDAVNDPLFGFLFDRIEFKNGLKSLPWLRVSVVLMPIVTIAVFSIPGFLGETGKLIWFGATYVLWDTVYTLTDAPAYAMLNTMTDNVQERTTLLSINRIYSGLGQGICGAVLTLLISEKIGLSASWASPFWRSWQAPAWFLCASTARSEITSPARPGSALPSGRCLHTSRATSTC